MPAPAMNPVVRELISRAIRSAFTDIRFRTEFTDESVLLTGQELIDLLEGKEVPPSPKTAMVKAALGLAKPTVVFNGPAIGQRVWAPYGEADAKAPAIWRGKMKFWLVGGLAALVGIGFGLGRLTAKPKGSLKGLARYRRGHR